MLKGFDLRKYLGNGNGRRPYTDAQLAVMRAGTAVVLLAIMEPTEERVVRMAGRLSRENIRRFHSKPRKTQWKGERCQE